jgi:2-phosphosulfolactate phosphatase
MADTFLITCFPASVARYRDDHAIVAIDVIRATTLAVSAVAAGRRCLVATDLQDALETRARLGDALLMGELRGDMPDGFDLNNSPSELARRDDIDRPLVMLSTSGTELMLEAAESPVGAYVACLRNIRATASYLAARHGRIAIIGAGSRGEFREEDQLGCARLAELLARAGYVPADEATLRLLDRWRDAPVEDALLGNSAAYLRRTGQLDDLDFVREHEDDVGIVCVVRDGEVLPLG